MLSAEKNRDLPGLRAAIQRGEALDCDADALAEARAFLIDLERVAAVVGPNPRWKVFGQVCTPPLGSKAAWISTKDSSDRR